MTKAYELVIFAGIWALLHGVTDIITGFQIKTTWAPARRCHGSALRPPGRRGVIDERKEVWHKRSARIGGSNRQWNNRADAPAPD